MRRTRTTQSQVMGATTVSPDGTREPRTIMTMINAPFANSILRGNCRFPSRAA
jgi:hypothetical protein